jgi:hypothetical protein
MEAETIFLPCVVRDHNSKTAIAIREGRKFFHLIPMKSGKLTVKKLTPKQFWHQYEVTPIDPSQAVAKYLAHSGGHTDTARQELLMLQEVFDVEYSA